MMLYWRKDKRNMFVVAVVEEGKQLKCDGGGETTIEMWC